MLLGGTGDLILVVDGTAEWTEGIDRADAVVLIGGLGGTMTSGRMAARQGKPVFPLADTGRDAKAFYVEMLRQWERLGPSRFSKAQFQRIARPATSSQAHTSSGMMDYLTPVDEAGVVAIEGAPGHPVLADAADVDRLLEACFEASCGAALLHAENLPPTFFDLSSGAAGAILQKLRQYDVRLAVVRGPEAGAVSARFGELVAEERMRRDFGVFASRAEARAWIAS